MGPVMSFEITAAQKFAALALVVILIGGGGAGAQTLDIDRLPNGTAVVQVAMPLAEATTVAWPGADDADAASGAGVRTLVGGQLTLVGRVEAMLSGVGPAPPVVVAVGSASAGELRSLLGRLLLGREVLPRTQADARRAAEGGLDRRLGTPGSEASLRLAVPMPPPGDPQRSPVEVLWEALPAVLGAQFQGLSSRLDGELGVLEVRVDPDLAELRVRALRLALARLASEPTLDEAMVAAARTRVEIRRLARLERHPEGGEALVRRWLQAGEDGVRELLFGTSGVTLAAVREAAVAWLPRHPGAAQVVLPPRVFDPRFAAGPERLALANDLAAVLLERPAAPLSAVALRPVIVPDVDGALSATVLARVAAELRSLGSWPGWIGVRAEPPTLELAGQPDAFPELIEGLRTALDRVVADDTAVAPAADDARRRTLALVGSQLGLTGSGDLSPALLLRPANLALGGVVPDGEAAGEALAKLLVEGLPSASTPLTRDARPGARTREAVAGSGSALAAVIPVVGPPGPATQALVTDLLRSRATVTVPEVHLEVLSPLVPGRRVLVVLVTADLDLDALEQLLASAWPRLTAVPSEVELEGIRQETAARMAAATGGTLGRASACAAIAAGERGWQAAREVELEVLSIGPEALAPIFAAVASWEVVETAGAGVMPIVDPRDLPPPRRR